MPCVGTAEGHGHAGAKSPYVSRQVVTLIRHRVGAYGVTLALFLCR